MKIDRRRLLMGPSLLAMIGMNPLRTQAQTNVFSLPIGFPGQVPGDGFIIRHGYACENTWYNPGYWHTGEDWYALEGETAGAEIYAVSEGAVVFADSDYPGRVVIVQHSERLFSMYGHLDPALPVADGDVVERGQVLGSVYLRTDGRAPSHLHFELRAFLIEPEVNGDSPRYGLPCGVDCPPGPGYWPIDALEHPSVIGWRNPTHVINNRLLLDDLATNPIDVLVAASAPSTLALWTAPDYIDGSSESGAIELTPGLRFSLKGVDAGAEASEGTSASAYRVWYFVQTEDGTEGWLKAVEADDVETGSNGEPSTVRFNLLPLVGG
jgi:murein DD-endopeptidase MepM/ murein hydrolase activator NlpD